MTHDERRTVTAVAEAATARPRARLIDVATAAGVSPKTVSRVINDEAGVLPGTRDRVLQMVRDLGFVPDRSARELKRREADTIGILIDAISDPFFAAFVSVVEELAIAEGLSVIFASTGYDAARETAQLDRLTGHRLAGLIVAPVAVPAAVLAGLRHRCPVVTVDRVRSGIDSIVIDDFGAAAEATAALLSHGHRRVAFMGEDVPYPTVSDRLAGYRSALEAAGVAFDPSLVVTDERFRAGEAAEASLLLGRLDAPTALLCATSLAAIATVRAIRARGLRMPALISFGDFTLAEVLEPGITYVDHDPRLLGAAAFRRLRHLALHAHDAPTRTVVPTRLVPRGSGEVPFAESDERSGIGSVSASAPLLLHPSDSVAAECTSPAAAALVHPEPSGAVAVPAAATLGAPS
ncbi:LacI family transcriptional regulator [Microbacterium testaceum]|uniref:LacI family DNA-binding transcriptional regulator n=1 Tax=Microbacterium TaxID=33882 RepID=UPI00278563E6|nr:MULTISPECIES: LacI family DNA-binding transcriptional regulator [Microbacterium]MDQ1112334.1 LacI family transcriptional regulator [Microbacterium testaceum]MDR6097129.1 LacI family transcriptional regulator [Microbacterium sp. SORGH_AS_0454]